jgi:hypothetical protein
MAEVVFVVDVRGWAKAFKSEKGMVGAWIADLTGDVVATTKFEAPGPGKFPRNRTGINYGKGKLMGTVDSKIHAGGIDEVEGHVIVKPEYARFVIHGTKPHVIKPKKPGGYLRFYWFKKAKWMVVRSVNHPGTAANDFMIRALRRGFRANGLI